jgi:hypothetical protein
MAKHRSCRSFAVALLSLAAIAVPSASAASLSGLTGTLGSALTAPVATLAGTASPCQGEVLSQPFAPWGDAAAYFPVANGSFEAGTAGWTLGGGAKVVSGGSPFLGGSRALDLPAGATASAPAAGIDAASPTLRLFAAGSGYATVAVVTGGRTYGIGTINANGTWAPTQAYLNVTSVLGLLSPTGTLGATFVFTAKGGDVRIDDVFVDPYRRT